MQIEIWSDVVCPWCYIGKRRFEAALAQFEHRDEVELVWRSFELDPTSPRLVEQPLTQILAKKYGMSVQRAEDTTREITALAAKEGLDFQLQRSQSGNTFDAHRLIHLAQTHGLQGAMKERLLHAYFTEGLAIGDVETLVQLAGEVGLDTEEARSVLSSDAYAQEVRADEQMATELGIRGVPFFVIDQKYGISGAQPTELFQKALQQAWSEARPLVMVSADNGGTAAVCDDDSCAV